MPDLTHLAWPFFDDEHRALAKTLAGWAKIHLCETPEPHDVGAACRALVRQLGEANWLSYCVPSAYGGAHEALDVRSLCLLREGLAYHSALADFSLVMQGLGSGAIALFGSEELKQAYLPKVASGAAIAAFALSEPEAGSDVSAIATTARRRGADYVLDGTKTWISNGGIADFYTVFARTGEGEGAKGLSAFVVPAEARGLRVAERLEVIAPHPLATLAFEGCRVPASHRVGQAGQGFKIAMATLDVFRPTVGAAALGFARRALDEALARATTRTIAGKLLSEYQLSQAKLAQMALEVDASALLVYRAAWAKDTGAPRITREAAMAKLYATEAAQRTVDQAVQLLGALGVRAGHPVERLYREVRALRIYEGASEVQQLIIARQLLHAFKEGQSV